MSEKNFNHLVRDIVDERTVENLPELSELSPEQADLLMDTVYMDHLLRKVDWSAIPDFDSPTEENSAEEEAHMAGSQNSK